MEQQTYDRELRLLFERNVPPVDADEVWRGVSREIGLRRSSARSRRPVLRVAMTAATVVLLVVGIGVGAFEAVTHLGKGSTVIVIGGTETPMTTAAPATTSTAAASATTVAGSAEFATLVAAWRTKGIVPLSVTPDPAQAKGIIMKVPADKIAPPDGIFYSHQLQRQAFLVTHQENLPFDSIQVYAVDANGHETLAFGMNPQAGMAFATDWSSGETLDMSTAGARLGNALNLLATSAGVQLGSQTDEGPDGRTTKLTVTLPAEGEIKAYQAFLEGVFTTMVRLNHEGCHIAVLELSVNDLDGGPILRDVVDYELQSGSAWWSSNDFTPPGTDSRPLPAATTDGT